MGDKELWDERDLRYQEHFAALDRRFEDIESHRIELRDLLKETVDETKRLLDEYKVQSNEWRGLANDLIANHPTKSEVEGIVGKVELKVGLMQTALGNIERQGSMDAGAKAWGIDVRTTALGVIAGLGVIGTFALGIYVVFGG